MTNIRLLIIVVLLSITLRAQNNIPDEWITQFEKSNYLETADYAASMLFYKKIADSSPYARYVKFGTSPQGRDMMYLIVSKDECFDAASAKKNGKPIILIENGIHAGEIEGKDACMIMLREMLITKEKEHLLDNVILLIIPILSVDSHERSSPYNRINQDGPVNMGWRSTSTNYNLNRDFVKADTPEMKAWLKLYNEWLPDFFIDSHTTDGMDLQYTLTYTVEKFRNIPPMVGKWLTNEYVPFIQKTVEDKGYLMAPYIWFVDYNMNKGLLDYVTPPKLSTGYAAVQNRPALLIETHSLKPYKERVFATQAIMEASIELFNREGNKLVDRNKMADTWSVKTYADNKAYFPLSFSSSEEPDSFVFKGIKWNEKESWITGSKVREYNGEPFEITIPHVHESVVVDSVSVPYAYLIPQEWKEVTDLFDLHGIEYSLLDEVKTYNVTRYRFRDVKFDDMPYEGRFTPTLNYDSYVEEVKVPKGTFMIKTAQRRLPLIIHMMEPKAGDSFLRWGFFNTIFVATEYFELYSMLPVAEKMVEENPGLKEEFFNWLELHPELKEDARGRMRFFYERSPYYDQTHNIYPIMRLEEKE